MAKLINPQDLVQIQYPSCGPIPSPGTVPKEVRFEFRARPGGRLLAAFGRVLHNVRGLLKRLDG